MGIPEANTPESPTRQQLEGLFHAGAKAPPLWRVGVEYEKPVVDAVTGESVPYEGARGIGRLLQEMLVRSDRWRGVHEGDSLIALTDGLASITLEPGGQFEMSGQQCESLHCAHTELLEHVQEIVTVGDELGLRFLGLGAVPRTPLARLPWMPKERYRIMRQIMMATGTLGHRMMQQTATVQCNFDYSSEQDASRKMRLAMVMSPLLVAVSANSPVVDGRPSGYRSFRAHVWSDTDPARCGFLPFVFETEALFATYTEYALDVPMYFVRRADRLNPCSGLTFRRFLADGWEGHRATLSDWTLHLTTLFPEVRLKTYIEVRAPDGQPVELMLATPAFMKGLLYDDDCLEAALAETRRWPVERLPQLHEEAAREGLRARLLGHTLRDHALELLEIASEGLKRQCKRDADGRDESIYLEPLIADVRTGLTPADRIIRSWENEWHGDIDKLIDYASYRV